MQALTVLHMITTPAKESMLSNRGDCSMLAPWENITITRDHSAFNVRDKENQKDKITKPLFMFTPSSRPDLFLYIHFCVIMQIHQSDTTLLTHMYQLIPLAASFPS